MENLNPTQQPAAPLILSQEEAEKVVLDLSENKSPEPSEAEGQLVEKINQTLRTMPTPVAVSAPNPPQRTQVQKTIPTEAQMEYLCKKICKLKGHTITSMVLHTTQIVERPMIVPSEGLQKVITEKTAVPIQNTIVICSVCGASLAQIRG